MQVRDDGAVHKSFRTAGGATEHFIAITVPGEYDFGEQVGRLEHRYQSLRKSLGLAPETAVWRRLFVSDVINQAPYILDCAPGSDTADDPVAISLVQQPPLPAAKVALIAYHIVDTAPLLKRRLSRNHVLVERNGRRSLWTTGLCAAENRGKPSAETQTRGAFADLISALEDQGGNLRDHCLRTWFFVKDVDVFYEGLVEGRAHVFGEQGLSANTHFIASTGIEGACAHRYDLVALDAYSDLDIAPSQISYLNDFDRLCHTKDYGVHFERGTTAAYGDRAHHFISGTASIDRDGQVLHVGDVRRQFGRAMDNVDALLRAGDATASDLMYVIVYLRDPTDYEAIKERLADRLPGIPAVVVQAAVCRPQWLVEIEGVAITPRSDPDLSRF